MSLLGIAAILCVGCQKEDALDGYGPAQRQESTPVPAQGQAEDASTDAAQDQGQGQGPVQFGETEGSLDGYPDYKASDYIRAGNLEGITLPDISPDEVTVADVLEEIYRRAADAGLKTASRYSVTDEEAALVSGQKYLSAAEYKEYIRSVLEKKAEYAAKNSAFMEILGQLYERCEVLGYPQEVLAYQELNKDSLVESYAFSLGLAGEDLERAKSETGIVGMAEKKMEEDLLMDMLAKYLAEVQGISVTDADYQETCSLLMEIYGYRTQEALERDLPKDKVMLATIGEKVIGRLYGE